LGSGSKRDADGGQRFQKSGQQRAAIQTKLDVGGTLRPLSALFWVGLLNAPRFWGSGVIQLQYAPKCALNAPKSTTKRLKRPHEFSM